MLGDDPERVALERLPDRHLARLAAAASGRLEEHVARQRQRRPARPLLTSGFSSFAEANVETRRLFTEGHGTASLS